jgi:hypothetical protein
MKHILILLFAITLCRCSFPVADIFTDPDIIDQPQDTTITAPVVVVDTCHQLVITPDTAFVTLGTYFFNGLPTNPIWRLDQFGFASTNLIEVLEFYWPQYSYTYYQEGPGVMAFIDGTDNSDLFQGKIWTTDLIGQRALLTANSSSMFLKGALTYEEAVYEVNHRTNVTAFGYFGNDTWTEAQNNTWARRQLHADICKQGEDRADFRATSTPILQSIKDSFNLFHWDNIQGAWVPGFVERS